MSELPFYREHRTRTNIAWAWFSHDAFRKAGDIEPGAGLQVYAALCLAESETLPKYKSGFTISHKELSSMAKVSVRTLRTVLATFQGARLIEIRSGKKGTKGEPNLANTYRLSPYGKQGGVRQPEHQGLGSQSTKGSAKEDPDNLPTKKDSFSPPPKGEESEKDREDKNKKIPQAASAPTSGLRPEGGEAQREEREPSVMERLRERLIAERKQQAEVANAEARRAFLASLEDESIDDSGEGTETEF